MDAIGRTRQFVHVATSKGFWPRINLIVVGGRAGIGSIPGAYLRND
jgi:hypothetical protein